MGMSGNGNGFFHPIFGNSQMFGNPGNGNQIRGNGNSHDWHMICRISLVNDEIPPGKELTFQNCRHKQKIYDVIPPGKKLTFQNCRNKQKIYEVILS